MSQPAIFISHAGADKALATQFTLFLREAIGVREADIFCSSVPGQGIPHAENFNVYIKDKIQHPKLVILLMTPAYMESWFCLMEMGAAWVQSAKTAAVVVPPVAFGAVTGLLGPVQAWKIENHIGLVDLKALIVEQVADLEPRSEHTWDAKRKQWMLDLPGLLKELQLYTKVEAATYEELKREAGSKNAEIEALRAARETDAELIKRIKSAKDAEAIKAIHRDQAGESAEQTKFEELMAVVRKALPKAAARVVIFHILMDYVGKTPAINWSNDKAEFGDAISYNLLAGHDRDYAVEWEKQKLRPLAKALDALVAFLKTEDGEAFAEERASDGVPMEPDDLAFWEEHL
jgi:hypothetical protein